MHGLYADFFMGLPEKSVSMNLLPVSYAFAGFQDFSMTGATEGHGRKHDIRRRTVADASGSERIIFQIRQANFRLHYLSGRTLPARKESFCLMLPACKESFFLDFVPHYCPSGRIPAGRNPFPTDLVRLSPMSVRHFWANRSSF